MQRLLAFGLIAACQLPLCAAVQLTTLPEREQTTIRFEDGGQVLVAEERTLTLNQGPNTVDFTWLGVAIDRSSIQLVAVDGVPFHVLRTAFPPGQDASLQWMVEAKEAGTARVRIAYLLSGLSREVSLRATVAEDLQHLQLRVFQRLRNDSGETFDGASLGAAFGNLRESPLANGEVREQLSARFDQVPVTRRYTFDPQQFGESVVVHYVVQHNAASGFPDQVLPGGKVRLFQAAADGEAFLGEDFASATAPGGELTLRIGDTRDITVRRSELERTRDIVQRDSRGRPALWNERSQLRWELENFSDHVRVVRIVEHVGEDWDLREAKQTLEQRVAPEQYEPAVGEAQEAAKLKQQDANTLYLDVPVPPGRRVVFSAQLRLLSRG